MRLPGIIYILYWSKMNQGKRKDQIEFSEKMAGGSMLVMIIIILVSWIWRLIG